ncbi:MAG TPA: shikimate dehydrogenase [Propionibacteriaceae bacterium]|nr:shikimate dehydrogenase [Propionibacteriaceae bacterium]
MTPDLSSLGEVRHCAVLGSPIEHSLSPALHRAAYTQLGLSWTYDRIEVDETRLAAFVSGLDASWRGLSLTMPLKVAVLKLGQLDELAKLAGAGNTLVLEGGERWVYNTDVGGLIWAVGQVTAAPLPRVTILGTGATARAALLAATHLGAQLVTIVARTPARGEALRTLADELGVTLDIRPWSTPIPAADLIVSTVVSGAADSIAQAVAGSAPLIVDIIYDPWPTVLAAAAQRAGCTVVGGLDLLVGQALLQIELMTGRSVAADVLYAALPTEVESRPAERRRVPDF